MEQERKNSYPAFYPVAMNWRHCIQDQLVAVKGTCGLGGRNHNHAPVKHRSYCVILPSHFGQLAKVKATPK